MTEIRDTARELAVYLATESKKRGLSLTQLLDEIAASNDAYLEGWAEATGRCFCGKVVMAGAACHATLDDGFNHRADGCGPPSLPDVATAHTESTFPTPREQTFPIPQVCPHCAENIDIEKANGFVYVSHPGYDETGRPAAVPVTGSDGDNSDAGQDGTSRKGSASVSDTPSGPYPPTAHTGSSEPCPKCSGKGFFHVGPNRIECDFCEEWASRVASRVTGGQSADVSPAPVSRGGDERSVGGATPSASSAPDESLISEAVVGHVQAFITWVDRNSVLRYRSDVPWPSIEWLREWTNTFAYPSNSQVTERQRSREPFGRSEYLKFGTGEATPLPGRRIVTYTTEELTRAYHGCEHKNGKAADFGSCSTPGCGSWHSWECSDCGMFLASCRCGCNNDEDVHDLEAFNAWLASHPKAGTE